MARGVNRHHQENNSGSDCNLRNLLTSSLITLNKLWDTPISVHTNAFDCYAFHIQINVTVVLLPRYHLNVTISCLAVLGNHQSLLGNQIDILGNHLPIKFGKPCLELENHVQANC